MRYTSTPRYGMTMMRITHSALAQPPMSWLRKMSMNTMNSSQIQMMKRKKYNVVRKMSRIGYCVASMLKLLSRRMSSCGRRRPGGDAAPAQHRTFATGVRMGLLPSVVPAERRGRSRRAAPWRLHPLFGVEPAAFAGGGEGLVVPLVLVGVGLGE